MIRGCDDDGQSPRGHRPQPVYGCRLFSPGEPTRPILNVERPAMHLFNIQCLFGRGVRGSYGPGLLTLVSPQYYVVPTHSLFEGLLLHWSGKQASLKHDWMRCNVANIV